jgi:hypothetical protein
MPCRAAPAAGRTCPNGMLLFVAGIVLAGAAFEIGRRQENPAEIALLLGPTRAVVAWSGSGACCSESSGSGSFISATSPMEAAA